VGSAPCPYTAPACALCADAHLYFQSAPAHRTPIHCDFHSDHLEGPITYGAWSGTGVVWQAGSSTFRTRSALSTSSPALIAIALIGSVPACLQISLSACLFRANLRFAVPPPQRLRIQMGNCLAPPRGGHQASNTPDSWAKVPRSPLAPNDIVNRIHERAGTRVKIGDRVVDFHALSFRGYYPDTPFKANQDEFAVLTPNEFGNTSHAIFGVFDGHGGVGDKCAIFAAKKLPSFLKNDASKMSTGDVAIKQILMKNFLDVNKQLHVSREIDDSMSGTTAVTALFNGNDLWVANVGDSRCIIISEDETGCLVTRALSTDQTPYRRDERARVRKYGARVLNVDQLEGYEPIHDDWDMTLGEEVDEGGDPPRIWAQDGPYPGTAFTRSIGDAVAEDLGVTAEPEVVKYTLSKKDKLLVVASDGVWEFLTNKEVMEIVLRSSNPLEAVRRLWRDSFGNWVQKESRTDDITAIVVDLENFYSGGVSNSEDLRSSSMGAVPGQSPRNLTESMKRARRGSTKLELGKPLSSDFVEVVDDRAS